MKILGLVVAFALSFNVNAHSCHAPERTDVLGVLQFCWSNVSSNLKGGAVLSACFDGKDVATVQWCWNNVSANLNDGANLISCFTSNAKSDVVQWCWNNVSASVNGGSALESCNQGKDVAQVSWCWNNVSSSLSSGAILNKCFTAR